MNVEDVLEVLTDTMMLDVDGPDDDLIESGEMDSLRFVELVLAIEREHHVRLQVADLRLEDLRTPNRIAAALDPLLAQAQ